MKRNKEALTNQKKPYTNQLSALREVSLVKFSQENRPGIRCMLHLKQDSPLLGIETVEKNKAVLIIFDLVLRKIIIKLLEAEKRKYLALNKLLSNNQLDEGAYDRRIEKTEVFYLINRGRRMAYRIRVPRQSDDSCAN